MDLRGFRSVSTSTVSKLNWKADCACLAADDRDGVRSGATQEEDDLGSFAFGIFNSLIGFR